MTTESQRSPADGDRHGTLNPRRLARWLFARSGPLGQKAVRGGIWLLLGTGAAGVASLLKLAVLGRMLSPTDFGLMGIAIVTLKWLEYFTETGFNAALIQKREAIRPYLDTALTVQIFRSIGLATALLLGAPLGAWFFANPDAAPVLRAVALVTLLRGFTNPAVIYLRKELDFHREVMWRLIGVSVGLVVAVPLAVVYRNVWALVLSIIAAQLAESLASYWIEPYRPRLRFEWARARELTRFGKWIFCSNMLAFLGLYVDSLTVGKALGAAALGFYQMAAQLAVFPIAQLGTHASGVVFPALSKLRQEAELRRAFLRTVALVGSLTVPAGCFLTVFAEPLVPFVLGPRWVSIAPAVQILAWAGVANALMWVSNALFRAVGRPDLQARSSLVKVCVLAGLIYPLVTRLGIVGAALAVVTATLAALAYQFFLVTRLLQPRGLELVAAFRVATLGSVPFLGAGLFVSPAFSPALFVAAGLATGAYLVILLTALRSHLGIRIDFSSLSP